MTKNAIVIVIFLSVYNDCHDGTGVDKMVLITLAFGNSKLCNEIIVDGNAIDIINNFIINVR